MPGMDTLRHTMHMLEQDRPPYRFRHGARRDVLLLCDHASNDIPEEFAALGLDAGARQRHVAWDPGAAGVTEAMAEHLDCPAFFGEISRLVTDLNRAPDAPDLIVAENDGTVVPGNQNLTEMEVQRRLVAYHRPYHHAIAQYLDMALREGERPLLISIHSFTPVYHGKARPWQVGVLWKQRFDWIDEVLAGLREVASEVGDNRPYDGTVMQGYTLETHAAARDLPHVLFELRQDLVADAAQCALWAQHLIQALTRARLLWPVAGLA